MSGAPRAVVGVVVPPTDAVVVDSKRADVEQPAAQWHEVVTVDEEKRRYLNGETKAVMEHVRRIKQTGQDTSVDQPWKLDSGLSCADTYWRSLKALRPYKGGPLILLHLGDVVVAFLGQLYRQGLIEANSMLACMWIFMPWFKYFMNVNPWVYLLEERFVQQISTSMQDMSLDEIADAGITVITRCKQTPQVRRDVDTWKFSPHYPFPPPCRRWAVGMQSGGVDLGRSFFLLVHTTHGFCKNGGSTEQFILSNSVMSPAYRVMLWYNNPYHHLTGWVEASISTGLPAQPEKSRGGEHPMWLVTSHSPFLSRRNAFTGPGHVDRFFDNFLPYFVRLARTLNRGAEAARQLDEGVISKDGVSRPAKGHNVPLVPAGSGQASFYLSKDKMKPGS